MWNVQLFKLNFDSRESDAVSEVMKSGWLTMGERIASFESSFSDYLGSGVHCTAVSNGTAALHMALLALNVGPGDEVIIPALTFVADANVVRLVGATPVLADCDSMANWNVSARTICQKITSRTKAIMVVHYAGYPCDMGPIVELCHDRNIKLIEDVAHAPGASVNGKVCGTFGDVGCFSFFSNKNLSIGEGGMVVSCDAGISQRLRYLRSHGMTTLTLDRHKGRAISYDVAEPGLNYRMDEIRAAIGIVQLEKLPAGNLRRQALTERYRSKLFGSRIEIPFSKMYSDTISSYHILPVLLPIGIDRIAVIDSLKSSGIQSSIHYPPFWTFTAFEGLFSEDDAPLAKEICGRELTLPLYPTMTDENVDFVIAELLKVVP